jgi:hypothetical protein
MEPAQMRASGVNLPFFRSYPVQRRAEDMRHFGQILGAGANRGTPLLDRFIGLPCAGEEFLKSLSGLIEASLGDRIAFPSESRNGDARPGSCSHSSCLMRGCPSPDPDRELTDIAVQLPGAEADSGFGKVKVIAA